MAKTKVTALFATRLRQFVEKSGKSINELGKEMDIGRISLSKYCDNSAEAFITPLASIASYFNVNADYLIGLTDYSGPTEKRITKLKETPPPKHPNFFNAALFGRILRILRLEKKLNQSQLGEKLGIDKLTVSSYENGENIPNIDFLVSVSMFFNVSIDSLLGLEKGQPSHLLTCSLNRCNNMLKSIENLLQNITNRIEREDTND